MKPEKLLRRRGLTLLLAAYAVLLVFASKGLPAENDASRLATIESLVERGTFAIDDAYVKPKVDRIMVGGRFYSSKPPVLSFLSAGAYWMLYNVFGLSFKTRLALTYKLVTLSVVGSTTLLLLRTFFKSLEFAGLCREAKLLLTAGLGLGTLILPYSLVLNNHTVAASLIYFGFYSLLRIKFGVGSESLNAAVAGFSTALASSIDVPPGLAFLALYLAYLAWTRKSGKTLACYLFGALPPLALYGILNIHLLGDLRPTPLHRELYDYSGSYWRAPEGVDALSQPKWIYAVNALIGSKGLFSVTPVLLISFYWLAKTAWGGENKFNPEARLVLAGSLAVTVFYIAYMSNYGGVCYGMRHFIPYTPLAYYFTAFALKKGSSKGGGAFASLLVASMILSAAGAQNPWRLYSAEIAYATLLLGLLLGAYVAILVKPRGWVSQKANHTAYAKVADHHVSPLRSSKSFRLKAPRK